MIYWIIGALLFIILVQILAVLITRIIIFTASKHLHNRMVWSLLRTKLEYFDKNTIGTILTKFTKDIAGLDDFIPIFMFVLTRVSTLLITVIIVNLIATPFLLIIIVISLILIYIVRRTNYLPGQMLEWLDSEARGPLNTRFSSVLDGLVSIRAYKKQGYFMERYYHDSDIIASVALSHYGANTWFYMSLDYIGLMLIFSITVFVFVMKLYTDWIDDNFLAIAITT